MSADHFDTLRERSCEEWLDAEAAILALTDRARLHSTLGTWLGWSILLSSLLAGTSGIAFLVLVGLPEKMATII